MHALQKGLTAEAEPKKVEPENCDKIGSKRPNKTKNNVCKKKPAASPGHLQLQKRWVTERVTVRVLLREKYYGSHCESYCESFAAI